MIVFQLSVNTTAIIYLIKFYVIIIVAYDCFTYMLRFSNPISVLFHFALMQNETKNQGCIPRRPKTAASVEQNNRESFFI
jgi:hypothetical protein